MYLQHPTTTTNTTDKKHRCFDTSGSVRLRQSRSGHSPLGRTAAVDPLLVFLQTTCAPAELTGRTCLLVERLAEKSDGKRGNLRESNR